jgi:predicted nucleic acid-binding protein
MKLVIDTNIVFSAILNPASPIGQIILNGSKYFYFLSIDQLKNEIDKHENKILKISGLS